MQQRSGTRLLGLLEAGGESQGSPVIDERQRLNGEARCPLVKPIAQFIHDAPIGC
jgi:hypothetical protein